SGRTLQPVTSRTPWFSCLVATGSAERLESFKIGRRIPILSVRCGGIARGPSCGYVPRQSIVRVTQYLAERTPRTACVLLCLDWYQLDRSRQDCTCRRRAERHSPRLCH